MGLQLWFRPCQHIYPVFRDEIFLWFKKVWFKLIHFNNGTWIDSYLHTQLWTFTHWALGTEFAPWQLDPIITSALFHDSFDLINVILLFVNWICHCIVKIEQKIENKKKCGRGWSKFKKSILTINKNVKVNLRQEQNHTICKQS